MKYLILIIFSILSGCIDCDTEYEEFKKSCPYDFKYTMNHYLKVPISISPHKMTYNLGDTIRISTFFSDSIYDLNTNNIFKIQDFPFKPITQLYRFYDGLNWDSGYRVNALRIDSTLFNTKYHYSSKYSDGFISKMLYENNNYYYEFYIVLKKKGRYIMNMFDYYNELNGTGNGDLNSEANAITFEGKCPTLNYYICYIIDGESHLENFVDELVHLDEEVWRNNLGTLEGPSGPLKYGSLAVEWGGFFGFEVVE